MNWIEEQAEDLTKDIVTFLQYHQNQNRIGVDDISIRTELYEMIIDSLNYVSYITSQEDLD